MLYAGSRTLPGSRLRRHGRGALPRRPLPRRGLGGGHHPPPGVGGRWCPSRRRSPTPRSSASGSRRSAAPPRRSSRRRRPVPLYQHVMVGRRMYDLFADDAGFAGPDARVNPELMRVARDDWRSRPYRRPARQARRPAAAVPAVAARDRAARPAQPVRRRGAARPRGAAAGDLLHLQPGRLRRRGPAVPRRQPAADHARPSATRSSRSSRSAAGTSRRGPDVLGYHDFLDGLTRGVAAHHAGMLPTFKECVEELFAARPLQGRLRHRDAGAGHQHAGPVGGHREAVEVERRDPRRHHAGGVHPAHRPGRAPRHRRGGPRRRAVAAGARAQVGGRAGLDPDLPAQVVVPAVVQHGRQPRAPGRPCHRAGAAGVVVRPVPGRQGGRRAGPAAAQGRGGARGVRRGGHTVDQGDFMEYAAPAPPALRRRGRRGAVPARRPTRRDRGRPWSRCAPAT